MARLCSCILLILAVVRVACSPCLGDETPLPGDVPSLIKLLHDKDPEVRDKAARRLGRLREKAAAAVPDLMGLLSDQGWPHGAINVFVCDAASEALRKIGGPAVQPLIEALKSPDSKMRERAAQTLAYMDPPPKESLSLLLPLLRDSQEHVRYWAVRAIGSVGKGVSSVIPSIVDVSKNDPESLVRVGAIEAAVTIDSDGAIAIPACVQALRDKDSQVRGEAAKSLGKYGPRAESAVAALTERLDDTAMRYEAISTDVCVLRPVRCDVAEALGKIGRAAAPALRRLHDMLRNDPEADVTAAQAILQIDPHDQEALPALIVLLKDEDAPDPALEALKNLGPVAKAAQPAIRSVLRHKEYNLRAAAVEALAAVAGREAIPSLIEQLEWEKRLFDARQSAPDADPLEAEAGAMFAAVAKALGTLGGDAAPAAPAISSLLSHPACWFTLDREEIVEALGAIGPAARDSVPQMMKLLDEDDDVATELRQKAAVALGRIGPAAKAAVPRLRQLADADPERDVRDAARAAVQEIAPDATARPVPRE